MSNYPKELVVALPATLNASDLEIGAVELKNASDDTRARIGALTGAASSDNGISVASFPVKSVVSTNNSLQSAASATGNGTALAVSGYGVATIEVTGTFVGTITWEGSRDGGTTYYSVDATAIGGSVATTATTTGLYTISVNALTHIRARVSAYTSGSITVVANLSIVEPLNQNHATTLSTQLGALIDKISTREEKYSYTNLTASALVRTGAGQVKGVFVASTTAGTFKLWDNTSAATTILVNTATPATVGWYDLGDAGFTTGLYCTIANTIDLTIVWKDNTVA